MASSFDIEAETIEFENLAKLAENVVYLLPGCTDIMIRKTLQDVYRDFCRRACCLRARRLFRADERVMAVAPMFGGVVDCVAEVRLNGRVLNRDIDYSVTDGNPPRVVVRRHLNTFRTHGHDVVEVSAVEIPGISSEQVPIGFLDRYGEIIVAGALARLQSMTGKSWSDPAQASANLVRYENGVGESRMRYHLGGENAGCSMDYLPDSSVLI